MWKQLIYRIFIQAVIFCFGLVVRIGNLLILNFCPMVISSVYRIVFVGSDYLLFGDGILAIEKQHLNLVFLSRAWRSSSSGVVLNTMN